MPRPTPDQMFDVISDSPIDVTFGLMEQNENFCTAMYLAIAQGLEHPPMIGVDPRPCTKNPIRLSPVIMANLRSGMG